MRRSVLIQPTIVRNDNYGEEKGPPAELPMLERRRTAISFKPLNNRQRFESEDSSPYPPSSRAANNISAEDTEIHRKAVEAVSKLNWPESLGKNQQAGATLDPVSAKLSGLPGSLDLDIVSTDKYFGDKAREKFFERCQWFNRQKNITAFSSNERIERLFFDNERPVDSLFVPFGPRRDAAKDKELEAISKKTFGARQWRLPNRKTQNDGVKESEDESAEEKDVRSNLEAQQRNSDQHQQANKRNSNSHGLSGDRRASESSKGVMVNYRNKYQPMYSSSTPTNRRNSNRKLSIAQSDTNSPQSNSMDRANLIGGKKPFESLQKLEEVHDRNQTFVTTGSDSHRLSDNNYQRNTSSEVTQLNGNFGNARPALSTQYEFDSIDSSITSIGVTSQERLELSTSIKKLEERTEFSVQDKLREDDEVSVESLTTAITLDFILSLRSQHANTSTSDSNSTSNLEQRKSSFSSNSTISKTNRLKSRISKHVSRSTMEKNISIAPKKKHVSSLKCLDQFEGSATTTIESPRTKYISGCQKERLNPRASLVLRKHLSKELNLQHHGLGDQMALLLSECLPLLPFVQSINIADNKLTDVSLAPILLAIKDSASLVVLNLSQNEIGPKSARSLSEYLMSENCPLQRLILQNADVDDYECEKFIYAVKQNKTLIELDLASNKIGTAENLNTVMPDLITGGEAIADLLRLPECKLQRLILNWNMIRLTGAHQLAQSISVNVTLLYLDLSYNSLGSEGGVILGMSLTQNSTLQTLKVANNNLDATASFTICAGIIENRGLKEVVLDGNPIGIQGLKALMQLPLIAGSRVVVSAANCNCSMKDPKFWFNFEKIPRDYDLDMSKGFDRAVAIYLLHLIAGHQTFIFNKVLHETHVHNKKKTAVRSRTVELVTMSSTERAEYFDRKQRDQLERLERVKAASSNIQSAMQLFQEVDVDGSGVLDKMELKLLMKKLGMEIRNEKVNEIFNLYDVDQGGSIDFSEFLTLLKAQNIEATARIHELTEAPVMALKSNPTEEYLPPRTGLLKVSVIDGFAKKDVYRILSTVDRENITNVAHQAVGSSGNIGGSSIATVVGSALECATLRIDEATDLMRTMLEETSDKVGVVKQLVVHMIHTNDARALVLSALQNDRNDMLRLKKEMGAVLRPILGLSNGYYVLDMAKEMDRLCLKKLLEVSGTLTKTRLEKCPLHGRTADYSQHGNRSSFRNEMLNSEPVVISPAFVNPVPVRGKLEFDFSGNDRPPKEAMATSDQRIIKTLLHHFLLPPEKCPSALYKLMLQKELGEGTLGCNGITYYETPMDRAKQISDFSDKFYNNLHTRLKAFEDAVEKEGLPLELNEKGEFCDSFERDKFQIPDHFAILLERIQKQDEASDKHSSFVNSISEVDSDDDSSLNITMDSDIIDNEDSTVIIESTGFPTGLESNLLTQSVSSIPSMLKVHYDENDDNDEPQMPSRYGLQQEASQDNSSIEITNWEQSVRILDEIKGQIKQRRLSRSRSTYNFQRRGNVANSEAAFDIKAIPDDFREKLEGILTSKHISVGAKGKKIVEILEEMFSRSWLFSRHLALIVGCFFEIGYFKQTKLFGTYRVDLIVALFARVIDLHNFELVMEVLSPFEAACVYCRLGWLNIYNPGKPEGSYELDLSRREERMVCKTLCALATREPGDNWIHQVFRWMKSMDPMPGWELTTMWLLEESMPMRGIMDLTYYSGEGKRKKGCRPYVTFRKSLYHLVLISEEEVVPEDVRSKPRPPMILPGEATIQKHINLWNNYLAPEQIDHKRTR